MLRESTNEGSVAPSMRLGILMVLLPISAACAAEDGGRPSDRALAPLVACRPISDARTRAICYDGALDKLQQSVAQRTVVVVDREQVKADFGFGVGPSLAAGVAARTSAPDPVREIDSTVAAVVSYGYELWRIRIATGALWQTTEAGLALPPKVGSEVHIRRGLLGSYVMYSGKNQAIRVRRVK